MLHIRRAINPAHLSRRSARARARAGGEEVVNQHQSGCGGDETVGNIIKLCGDLASCRDSDLTLSILSRDFIDFQAATGRNRLRADA